MEQVKTFNLQEVQYQMTPANAGAAWTAIKNALKLLQDVKLSGESNVKADKDNAKIGANMLTAILANLGDPSIKALEDIILKHTVAQVNGQNYRLSDKFDSHFNQFRGHLLHVLKEGLIYQFADFFIGGDGLPSIIPVNLKTA